MQRTKWTERTFTFDFPEGWLPAILERLRGTPPRLREITSSLSDDEAKYNPGGKWSIKENIGHLTDLEELHDSRIDDFIAKKQTLHAADMKNTKTFAANHNTKMVAQLVDEFTQKRTRLISRLESLDDETQTFRSLHPRLQVMMRPVDLAYFIGEHDDHHLATIREIFKK